MNEDEQPRSLADQAAAWVPPWQRVTPPTTDDAESEVETDDTDADDEPAWQQPETDELVRPYNVALADEGTAVGPDTDRPADAYRTAITDEGRAPTSDMDRLAGTYCTALTDEDRTVGFETDRLAGAYHAALTDESSVVAPDTLPPVDAEPDRADDEDEDDGWQQPETDTLAEPTIETEPAVGRTTSGSESTVDRERPDNLPAALEAILLVVDEPVSPAVLAEVLGVPTDEATAALEGLAAQYTEQGRGFDLRRAAGGWRLYTRGDYASYVERFVLDGQSVRLTQAALETLAVIAYQQPVTRSRMSAIRGVNCDGVVRTLSNRGLIEECGATPDSGAFLYRTTSLFLEKLGLDSLDELPPLAPFLPDDVNGFADA